MKFAEFGPLIGSIVNLLLAIFVLSRNTKSSVNRVYFLVGVCISVWNFGSFSLFGATSASSALFWARFLQFGLIFGTVLLFHLSLLIAQLPVGKYIWGFYGFEILLAATNCTSFFIKDVRWLGTSGWYAVAGPGFYIFNLPFSLLFISIIILLRRRRTLPALHRTRLDALIFAFSLLVFLGSNDVLPIVGIDHYPFTKTLIYPYGSLAANFYGIIVAYSVLQHQLLDVQVALSRVVAHAMRLGFLFAIGAAMLLTITAFAPRQFSPVSFFSALGVLLLSGVIASLAFPKLFGNGSDLLERRILGDRFEYHDQITAFISSMQWYNNQDLLLSDLQDLLVKTVKLKSYQIVLLEETSQAASVLREYPERDRQQLSEITGDSVLFQFFRANKVEFLGAHTGNESNDQGIVVKARERLRSFNAEFVFPFSDHDEPFGLLLVGEKTNRDPYTATDVNLLVGVVKNLSLVINQIRLKNQVLQAQELELLGRMSRGMAHDLNNLLTPIWTFLQLSSEGVPLAAMADDLVPVAMRNLKTVRSYIREALFFSENLRPDFQLGRLDVLLGQAIDLVADRRDQKKIRIESDSPGEVMVEMDEVLIQRLIGNVIANAIDASPAGSTIRAEIVRLNRAQAKRDWLRVRVIDSGGGIREEDLARVMTPYFTTKNRGDESRGFGLGLAICRKIANLHGGNLTIASELNKGTTVQLDLPASQTPAATNPMTAQLA